MDRGGLMLNRPDAINVDGSLRSTAGKTSSSTAPSYKQDPGQAAPQETTAQESARQKIESGTEPELTLDPAKFPVDRYKAIEVLGMGGSGTVYLCRDRLLNKKVAVKTLHQLTAGELISFQKEARANSKLSHPAILTLIDFGPTECGAPYMVLEFFQGITLAQHLARHGPLSLSRFVQIFDKIASALAHAHSQGIYHRDVKPSNILISKIEDWHQGGQDTAPEVRLIDFGIAAVNRDTMKAIVIGEQTLAGTPAYMAPDSFLGRAYDARSEIYGLGCVLFESLTGAAPFAGTSALEILNSHARQPVPTLSEHGGRPFEPALESLISKCLSKEPSARFGSMEELRRAILNLKSDVELEQSSPTTETRKEPGKLNFRRALIPVSVVVLLAVSGIYFGSSIQPEGNVQVGQAKSHKLAPRSNQTGKGMGLLDSSKDIERNQLAFFEQKNMSISELEQGAANGDANKQYMLAYKYEHGDGVLENHERAFYWYMKAAGNGHVQGMNSVGWMYHHGDFVPTNYKEALFWYHKAARQNCALSQGNIGTMYQSGSGVRQDYAESIKWFQKAVAQGEALAQSKLGYAYKMGLGVEKSYGEAVRLFRLSAAQNDSFGITNLAAMYSGGLGIRQDTKEAVRLYRRACALGNPSAFFDLGLMYESGHGVQQDFKEAAKLYASASALGDGRASNNLAWLYQHGLGVKKDAKEAIRLYQLAAKKGISAATCNLGELYELGLLGVSRNPGRAIEYYRKAAALNNARAQNNLGWAYERGMGVKKNYKEAVRLFRLAAANGNALAWQNLGAMYVDGLGVAKNGKEAVRLFRESARLGNAGACFALGHCYEHGVGVKKDRTTAIAWYQAASDKGHKAAKDRLLHLNTEKLSR